MIGAMCDVWRLAQERMVEVLRRPGNLILAVGVTALLSIFAAPVGSDPIPIDLALSGRLFLLVTGIAGLFGYTFTGSRRPSAEIATDEIVSLRALVLGRIVSGALLACGMTWLAVLLMLAATFVRHGTVPFPDPWVLGYAVFGPLVVAGAFAGAMTMARLLLRRSGRSVVAWILFLPWMLTFAAFRVLGGLPAAASLVVLLSLLSGFLLCGIEALVFLRFVPNRLTMRPG